ncbi:uncharacterized protein LOC108594233 [Drosophila busckii]|uniref:uncharacterized protein LOC108594233 n=1 Tax=Drosophila busckii TaxID=30019 RepID=UPI001432E713|nr:uncharacterized protein LOC108594233 [Drosophila busckii]XP_017834834.2 uncharacterized protein LOC108594233 [Drosophila busckii]
MISKQPDYIISELGYPQWQQLWDNEVYKMCLPPAPPCSSSSSSSVTNPPYCSHSSSKAKRLLPWRETLDDCYKRLQQREQRVGQERSSNSLDVVAQQKWQKNHWNEQQRANSNNNSSSKRNQKCRNTTTDQTTTTTWDSSDLNSF